MALALEGTPVHKTSSGSASEVMPAFTTTQAAEIFFAATVNNQTVTSITGGGLTWARRGSAGGTSPIELWAAKATGALSGVQFTINFTGGPTFFTGDVFAFSGQDTTTIWDSHASVPTTGTSDPLAISTNNANDVIIAVYRESSASAPTEGTGFTKISGADFQLVEYKIVAATQSSLSCTQGTGAGSANGGVVDALMEASGGGTQTFSYTASGGLTFAGTAAQLRALVKTAAGGLTFAGTATKAFVVSKVASGGIVFGGAATVAFHEAARIVQAAGGIVFGGASDIAYAGGIVANNISTFIVTICRMIGGRR